MARRTHGPARPARPAVPGGQRGDLGRWASGRLVYVDNLKVLLIVAIIALHGVLGYAGFLEAWSYSEVREVTLSAAVEIPLLVLLSPLGFTIISLLFLVAGLLTPPALARKGPRAFARDRLLRLGIPYAVFVLVLQPVMMYALEHPLGNAPGSYWDEFIDDEGTLDSGVLWFVGTLLIFSLAYAGWAAVRRPAARRGSRPVTLGVLVLVTAVVAVASFVVRLVWPYGSESWLLDLNFWQWPSCIAMFTIGIAGSARGWLARVPDAVAGPSRTVAVAALVVMAGVLATVGFQDRIDEAMGGWSWAAAAFTVTESTVAVFGAVWLLGVAQRHLRTRHRHGPVLSRCAYAAFMVQGLVLVGLAVLLRPVGVPAEVKALLVATGGVAGSFALAWLLLTRVPGVSRVL